MSGICLTVAASALVSIGNIENKLDRLTGKSGRRIDYTKKNSILKKNKSQYLLADHA